MSVTSTVHHDDDQSSGCVYDFLGSAFPFFPSTTLATAARLTNSSEQRRGADALNPSLRVRSGADMTMFARVQQNGVRGEGGVGETDQEMPVNCNDSRGCSKAT